MRGGSASLLGCCANPHATSPSRGGHSCPPAPKPIEILSHLVAFDTTSPPFNLLLIAYAESLLLACGGQRGSARNDATGSKANLGATIRATGGSRGIRALRPPDTRSRGRPGLGEQTPFRPGRTPFYGLLHGRGTCDMKGFLAVALFAGPRPSPGAEPGPSGSFSPCPMDEEVGCIGVRGTRWPELVAKARPVRSGCIVGRADAHGSGHSATRPSAALRIVVRGHGGAFLAGARSSSTQWSMPARIVVKIREMGKGARFIRRTRRAFTTSPTRRRMSAQCMAARALNHRA